MEEQSASVAHAGQESGEDAVGSQLQRAERSCDLADADRTDLDRDLAGLTVLGDRRCVLQSAVEGRQAGGRVTHDPSLEQLRRQNHAVHAWRAGIGRGGCGFDQLAASWDTEALRASSFSPAFIITDGVVSALSLATVRWRNTASL